MHDTEKGRIAEERQSSNTLSPLLSPSGVTDFRVDIADAAELR
jgi:hypothetical protein